MSITIVADSWCLPVHLCTNRTKLWWYWNWSIFRTEWDNKGALKKLQNLAYKGIQPFLNCYE